MQADAAALQIRKPAAAEILSSTCAVHAQRYVFHPSGRGASGSLDTTGTKVPSQLMPDSFLHANASANDFKDRKTTDFNPVVVSFPDELHVHDAVMYVK